jgi:DnaJ-class molecular chaperone
MGERTEWRCAEGCSVRWYASGDWDGEHGEGCRLVLVVDAAPCDQCDGEGTDYLELHGHILHDTPWGTCSACGGTGVEKVRGVHDG